MHRTWLAVLSLVLVSPLPLAAADAHRHAPAAGQPAPSAGTEGEVRRVDREGQKLTIRHGPLPKLDMPPMTMVFRVQDPSMLEQVKAGDRIRFEADRVGNAYVVTRIEPAQ